MIKQPILAVGILLSFFAQATFSEENVPSARPNIILMMTDDQGWGDLSLHGNPRLETPNIDRFAQESLQFNTFRVNPACAPTRASLLTGRHYHRTGVWGVHGGRDYLSLDETLISELLRDNGYRTAMIGKWHNGKSGPYLPWNRGFDDAWFKNGLYDHDRASFDYNGQTVEGQGWAREMAADLAIDYLRQAKERPEPFFLYLPFPTPHTPSDAPEAFIEKYRQRGCGEALAKYYAMLDHLDQNIGRILKGVDELGLRENTIVFFLSDNGPTRGGQTPEEFAERNPRGWRGAKGGIWENGVRSPLFVRWPGHAPVGASDAVIHVTDLFPTLASIASCPTRDLRYSLDGQSFLPALLGKPQPELSQRALFEAEMVPWWEGKESIQDYLADRAQLDYSKQSLSVIKGRYKLLKAGPDYPGEAYQLYDLETDPQESRNIAAAHPKIVDELKRELADWYQPLLADAKTFSRPILQIGWPGEDSAQLWLNCAHRKSPEIETWVFTSEFNRPGTFMELVVDIMQEGRYKVTLHGTTFPGSTWEVSLDGQTLRSSGSGEGDVPIGEISLRQKGQRVLRLELAETPENGPAAERLFYLTFQRMDAGE